MAILETILGEVQTRITARISGVTYRFGHKFLEERVAGMRVIWVPGKDLYGPAKDGRQTQPRSVRTRRAEVHAYVVAGTFGDTETLVNAVVYAVHQVLVGCYEIEHGDWTEADWLDKGYACVLRFLIEIPITAPTTAYTLVDPSPEFDTSATVQADLYLDAGEST